MKPKPTSPVEAVPLRVVIVTLDNHLSGAALNATQTLRRELPGLTLSLHAASDWAGDPDALERCKAAVAEGDIIVVTMLFMEEHIRAILPALQARRERCDALLCALSAGEVIRLTKLGNFRMDGADKGPMALLKRLRGARGKGASSGAGQMAMLRRLPKLLRYIPGPAQDLRAYFLTLQYYLAGSEANFVNMIRALIERYASGPRAALRQRVRAAAPEEYAEVGLYHPALAERITEDPAALPGPALEKGVVGLVILRSYVLAGDAAHYDGVIAALEARGLKVLPAFASGLDARPAIDRFFAGPNGAKIDALVSLTGFSLVGGPAYNDAPAAAEALAALDRPYIAAHPLEFQTLEAWGGSATGLTPVEAAMMVAIPEIDGATGPIVFGGRSDGSGEACQGCGRGCRFEADGAARRMRPCPERAERLAARVAKLIELRRTPKADRRIAVTLFNFPPNAGAVGTAAFLSVFTSLQATLTALKAEGYTVDLPESEEALRRAILEGNAARYGADANVAARIPAEDHVRREPHLAAIEAQWGPAPGRQQSDGGGIFVFGARFGNVFVGVQPAFGYEGDPMRLLFEGGFAPTHAFSAYYRWLREDFRAHAILHFGTHGALEFMPGKQMGVSGACWPDRLIGDAPNFYLYAANNPSEGALAKRRSAATLISYLTPPVTEAGLYKGLCDLKASIERWRAAANGPERAELLALIREQAEAVELLRPHAQWSADAEAGVAALSRKLYELETALIPEGLHVFGAPPEPEARARWMEALATGGAQACDVAALDRALQASGEMAALLHALDGGFTPPAPGGDLLRTPAILPTGRNLHGFDPYGLPSAFALREGARQANLLIERHRALQGGLPASIAMVLWGSDNLKTEGGPIAQALALMGAKPRHDSYGRVCGAELLPLAELGRPRVDVVMTISGVFRDLLPLQARLLAEAAYLAATAEEEPLELNPIRAHALARAEALGCDLETAALRVFSNAEGAYGANVNQLIDAGLWKDEEELGQAFEARKCFAYGRSGKATRQSALFTQALAECDLAYQCLDSVELGVTSLDQYVDTLGGVSRAIASARGAPAAVYVGDHTQGQGRVRTLDEQVALEAHTRMLNPRWYEGMLRHGHEGVRQIEQHVTNTVGWSATTGRVDPWVYRRITETYVLDAEMRARLAALNPKSSARLANRLLEASARQYWSPDPETLKALQAAADDLEDQLEGVGAAAAA